MECQTDNPNTLKLTLQQVLIFRYGRFRTFLLSSAAPIQINYLLLKSCCQNTDAGATGKNGIQIKTCLFVIFLAMGMVSSFAEACLPIRTKSHFVHILGIKGEHNKNVEFLKAARVIKYSGDSTLTLFSGAGTELKRITKGEIFELDRHYAFWNIKTSVIIFLQEGEKNKVKYKLKMH